MNWSITTFPLSCKRAQLIYGCLLYTPISLYVKDFDTFNQLHEIWVTRFLKRIAVSSKLWIENILETRPLRKIAIITNAHSFLFKAGHEFLRIF